MSRQCESKRRKDICVKCKDFKPIKAKLMCQNCWVKVKKIQRPDFYLQLRYTQINQRCNNKEQKSYPRYKGKMLCTREQFLNKFTKDRTYLKLFRQWVKSGFNYKLTPSIDRINNNKGYSISNMQCLTHAKNSYKDSKKVKVNVFTREGKLLGTFTSLNDAVRKFDVQQSNAWKVLDGQRKHTEQLVFKRA